MGDFCMSKLEIERKYIIEMPDASILSAMPDYTVSRITQIYLVSPAGRTHRIRRREYAKMQEFTETVKIRIDKMTCNESESLIDSARFDELSLRIRENTRPIIKTRHTFSFHGFTVEIDVYPEWERTAIMEIELASEKTCPNIPPFIRIVREVTGNRDYSNAAMSNAFPPEDHL